MRIEFAEKAAKALELFNQDERKRVLMYIERTAGTVGEPGTGFTVAFQGGMLHGRIVERDGEAVLFIAEIRAG